MQTHSTERPEPGPQTESIGTVADHVVMPVGTFAEGQSELGSFRIAAETEVGSFASGLEADTPQETA